jgi:hypothetical protein
VKYEVATSSPVGILAPSKSTTNQCIRLLLAKVHKCQQ